MHRYSPPPLVLVGVQMAVSQVETLIGEVEEGLAVAKADFFAYSVTQVSAVRPSVLLSSANREILLCVCVCPSNRVTADCVEISPTLCGTGCSQNRRRM